jgi:uncharacterized protein (TIGR02466 family)
MIDHIFPTKIFKSKYTGDLKKLQESIIPALTPIFNRTKENNQGSMRYDGLCSYNVCRDLQEHVDLLDLTDFVNTEISKFWEELNFSKDGPNVFQIWANRYPPGSYIDAHNHSPITLTASFYLKKPDNSGEIVFENPLSTLLKHQPTRELNNLDSYHTMFDTTINVEEGELVIFPGWLTHKTQENKSNEDRIIIGFNVVAK